MINKTLFHKMVPKASIKAGNLYYDHLASGMEKYTITTRQRIAMFIANLAHESGNFTATVENMNYSAIRLAQVWPKRFAGPDKLPNALAKSIERQPEKIANIVYSNRMGNGPPESGDGWKFRGRGLIGTTGKENYQKTGIGLGIDLLKNPELLEQPKYAVLSACWFWKWRGLNELADTGDFVAVVKKINGGVIGLKDRQEHYGHILKII